MIINRKMRTAFLAHDPVVFTPEMRELARIEMESVLVTEIDQLIALCSSGKVDSVVLGQIEPSTFHLIRTLKSDPNTSVPIMVLLSSTQIEHEPMLLLYGADEVLVAPWNPEGVRIRLERMSRMHLMHLGIESQAGLMQALAQTVEKHDIYTAQHVERLRFLSGQLALQMGQSPKVVAEIRAAGLLHDIGKIAVPAHILRKTTGLTPEEWLIIRQHPIHGEEIARNLPFGQDIAPMVRAHHERWDGRGYPDGLGEKDIPLGGRIVSVVDAFDAMTTNRPYRAAMTIHEAKLQLINGMGTQFDQEVVEGLLDMNPALLHKRFGTPMNQVI